MATMDYENENGRYDGMFASSTDFKSRILYRILVFFSKY